MNKNKYFVCQPNDQRIISLKECCWTTLLAWYFPHLLCQLLFLPRDVTSQEIPHPILTERGVRREQGRSWQCYAHSLALWETLESWNCFSILLQNTIGAMKESVKDMALQNMIMQKVAVSLFYLFWFGYGQDLAIQQVFGSLPCLFHATLKV